MNVTIESKILPPTDVPDSFDSAHDRGDLSLVFQPIRPIESSLNDEADYFEALLRVKEVSPITFLDRLSPQDYFKLDLWIAAQVQELPRQHRYAVNVSSFSFSNLRFIEMLLRSSDQFVLELTEHRALDLAQSNLLTDICAKFSVMIDDIGSAHSGLNRLLDFNFRGIKIDGHLIMQIAESFKARAIVGGLLRMAEELRICCVCECVETIEIWHLLRDIHAAKAPSLELYVQGWGVGLPRKVEMRSGVGLSLK